MKRLPFMLRPAAKDYLWGGSRLNDDFNFGVPVSPFAEAWVCSTHPDGVSFLNSGEPLSEVLGSHPEWLGSHVLQTTGGKPELPILIKLIDAKDDLSVQVHPDDDYAIQYEGQWGKTEMWYVLAARKDSELGVFLANEAADEYRRQHNKPGNKYQYTVDFSTAIRTARKYFLHKPQDKEMDVIGLLCRFVHVVKEKYRKFARPLRGIGAIRFNYR